MDESEPREPLNNPGLHYPSDYVLQAFYVYRKSGYTVWPNGKSRDEQDRQLIDDFDLLLYALGWHIDMEKPPR